jgi:SAM-dependent methyltransferase
MNLTVIANRMMTDKGTQTGAAHGYSLIYDSLFAALRDRPRFDLLEMGLAIGGPELGGSIDRNVTASPSVNMWIEFFPHAHITGFDISDFSSIQHDRFTFLRGDSGKREDVERIKSVGRQFDVILDDASHASYHQQLGLAVLFDSLKPGGLYIIEDLGWQPQEFERSLPAVPKTAKLLAEFLATGRLQPTAAISPAEAAKLERAVSSIQLWDESQLNALADTYNRTHGLASMRRPGWRGKGMVGRLLSLYFWLYSLRRFTQGLTGRESANWQSVKLAILQRSPD